MSNNKAIEIILRIRPVSNPYDGISTFSFDGYHRKIVKLDIICNSKRWKPRIYQQPEVVSQVQIWSNIWLRYESGENIW
jgi:hypothetical protein